MPVSKLLVWGHGQLITAVSSDWSLRAWQAAFLLECCRLSCSNSPSHTPYRGDGPTRRAALGTDPGGRWRRCRSPELLSGHVSFRPWDDAEWLVCVCGEYTQELCCLPPPGAGCRDPDEQHMATHEATYSLTLKCFNSILQSLRYV